MVAVSGDYAAQSPITEQIGIGFFDVQGDGRATLGLLNVFNREFAIAFTHPTHRLARRAACTAGFHRHVIGHDESRIKAHTELANQIRVFFRVTRQLFKKRFGARFGDGAQVFNHFFTAHADAIVGDGDGFSRRIAGNANLQIAIVFQQSGIVQSLKTQFIGGVGGIGNQFTQEDFFVGIQRVNHQLQ